MSDISIVIPLLNEQESLEPLLIKIEEVMTGSPYEVMFVDDGSTDGSFVVLEQLATTHPHVGVIQLTRNYGKAAALATGFAGTTGEVIITMDADLEDDPSDIPRLLTKLDEGYDMVVGWRRKRQHSTLRKNLPSLLFNRTVAWVTGLTLHDINCGLKAIRRPVVSGMKLYGDLHRYIPILAHWEGFRVGEVEVSHRLRPYGVSKYGFRRFFNGFLDLMTVTVITRYIAAPLHLFGTIGITLTVAGLIINGYLTVIRFQYGSILGRHPLLMLGVLLMILGIQFVSTGLLGEMIARSQQERETSYTIRKKLP
ncbi:MAG: glycosyltransferase family 2 protein [Candidatus Latescibacteria bacterium]|nr:glycosyltransferase family 2 protein [Candidatus Latescibacterota bacterium]